MSTRAVDLELPRGTRLLGGLLAAELLALAGYYWLVPAAGDVPAPRYVLYPLVWITAGVWAVARTETPDASHDAQRLATGLATVYFLLLAWLTGLLAVYVGGHGGHAHVHGLSLGLTAPPGWGPRVALVTDAFHVYFVPFRVVGYLALSYLLYVTILDATSAAVSGVVGLVTCLSCAFPLVASAAGGVGAAAFGVYLAEYAAFSLDVSTAAFLVTLGLLYWRPLPLRAGRRGRAGRA